MYSVSGQILNKNNNTVLIGCSVYNITKQRGTISNEEGLYRIGAERGDLLQFTYIGMAIVEKYVIDSSAINIEMVYQVKKIKNVTIKGENLARNSVLYNPDYEKFKNYKTIEPTRKSASEMIKDGAPKLTSNGITMSPITMLYYALNKRERRRLDAIMDIEKLDVSNKKYSLDFISMVTKVEDIDELKDIKAYCYFPHDQVINSSFYDLGIMLKDCYIDYLEYRKSNPIPVPATDSIPKD